MEKSKTWTKSLPRYECHKEVRALKIKWLTTKLDDGAVISPEDVRHSDFDVSEEYCEQHQPKPGGYYVVYEDGYESWSPAKAFEDGYTRIED